MDYESQETICRFCHGSAEESELIVPCACSGSIKYVHRTCLDSWRAASPNPQSFSNCDVCHFTYRLRELREKHRAAQAKFVLLMLRDFFLFAIVVNALILGLGFLASLVHPNQILHSYLPSSNLVNPDWSPAAQAVAIAYECGAVVLLFIIGVVGSCVYCVKLCTKNSRREPSYSSDYYVYYPYNSYYFGDWWFLYWISCQPHSHHVGGGNDCAACCYCCANGGNCGHGAECGNCGGGCGNVDCGKDLGSAALIVVLVIVLVFVVLGIVFSIIAIIALSSTLSKRHIRVLKNRTNCAVYEVVDLAKHPELRDVPNDLSAPLIVSPSAPLLMQMKSGV